MASLERINATAGRALFWTLLTRAYQGGREALDGAVSRAGAGGAVTSFVRGRTTISPNKEAPITSHQTWRQWPVISVKALVRILGGVTVRLSRSTRQKSNRPLNRMRELITTRPTTLMLSLVTSEYRRRNR